MTLTEDDKKAAEEAWQKELDAAKMVAAKSEQESADRCCDDCSTFFKGAGVFQFCRGFCVGARWERARLKADLDKAVGALEYVVDREDFSFAECSEAEEIWNRARAVLAEVKGKKE